jgi:uncharacterized membrane protein YdbT with pleckstrin-like domain
MLNLDQDEKVILEVRKHWYVFVWTFLGLVMGLFLPIAVFITGYALVPLEFKEYFLLAQPYVVFIYFIYALGIWASFAMTWTNFYLDVWYVTEKRIIDIDQKRIFNREISNLRFDKIQDISIEVKGVIATFLNFGDIRVQTAGEDSSEFFMKNASNPERVRKIIFNQHNKESERPVEVKIEEENKEKNLVA